MSQLLYPQLRDGLVGAWCPSVDRSRSQILTDFSGYSNHGTLTNMAPATDWAPSGGKISLLLDGVDAKITFSERFEATSVWTIAAWVMWNGDTSAYAAPVAIKFGSTNGNGFTTTNAGRYQPLVNNAVPANTGNYLATANEWVHVLVTYNGTAQLFANGLAMTGGVGDSGYGITESRIGQGFSSNYFGGAIDDIRVYNRELPLSQIQLLATRRGIAYERDRKRRAYVAGAGGPTYTLTCDAGSYALTGQDSSLVASRLLTCDAGSYSLTGQDASITANRLLTSDSGSYALTGQDASLVASRLLTADAGSYALSGQDASLLASRLLTADAGEYILTGQDADLTYSGSSGPTYTLSCDAGSYSLTGQTATLTASRLLTCDAGSYLLTGQAATLSYSGAATTSTLTIDFQGSGVASGPTAVAVSGGELSVTDADGPLAVNQTGV